MSALFPRWMNVLPTLGAMAAMGGGVLTVGGVWYYFTPKFWEVGYMPVQPGSGFNHQIHAGKLGIDCRYCHSHIDESKHANIPSVHTCYGCHQATKLQGVEEKTAFVRDAYLAGERYDEIQGLLDAGDAAGAEAKIREYEVAGLPVSEHGASIAWRQIHVIPDYANFPHSVHLSAGVSCYSCHGQIKGMPVVYQAQPLSMGWCLDCHRDPGKNLVPPDRITDLIWVENEWFAVPPEERVDEEHGGLTPEQLVESLRRNPPDYCGACHY